MQEQEENQGERKEAATSVTVIARAGDAGGGKRSKRAKRGVAASPSQALQRHDITTFYHLLSSRDIAPYLLAFVPSLSALRVGETSKALHPLVDAAITHVAMNLLLQNGTTPPLAQTLSIASRFPILSEVRLHYLAWPHAPPEAAVENHFAECLIHSGLHKRIHALDLHGYWATRLLFGVISSAPWPFLRSLFISPELSSFLERLQQTTTTILVNVEVLGRVGRGDVGAVAEAVCGAIFPRLQCIDFFEALYGMSSLNNLATVLTEANHTKRLKLSLGNVSDDPQLLEPLTQAIATGPCFFGMRCVPKNRQIYMSLFSLTQLFTIYSNTYTHRDLRIFTVRGNGLRDLLFALGKRGRAPMLETLELSWYTYWRHDEEQQVTETMDSQVWPCLRNLSFPIRGLAGDRALVTGLLSAPGSNLSTMDLSFRNHQFLASSFVDRVGFQSFRLVLNLIGKKANRNIAWRGSLTSLSLPRLEKHEGWEASSYVRTTKAALLRLPRLERLHAGLSSLWWICGVLEAFEENGLRRLQEWHFQPWDTDKGKIDGLLMLVAWLKEENGGLASHLEVSGLKSSSYVRDKILRIVIPALSNDDSFVE